MYALHGLARLGDLMKLKETGDCISLYVTRDLY